MSLMFPISMAPGPHSSISEGFLHSIFSGLRRILGSWILVNPLLSMNEAWRGREGQAAINPVKNLRTLWNGLRTPWKVSEPRGGDFLKKTLSNINITCKLAIIIQFSRHMDSINTIIKLKKYH